MSKKLLTLLCLCAGFMAQAQISIVRQDMPSAGDKVLFSIPLSNMGIDPKLTGPNYTWDFSWLRHRSQRVDTLISRNELPITLRFLSPASTSYAGRTRSPIDSIPGVGIELGDFYDLNRVGNSGLENLGQSTVIQGFLPVMFTKNPTDFVYRFPLNYGNRDSSNSIGRLDLSTTPIPGIPAVYLEQVRKRVNHADGWGTLTTPFGTFNVLRVRSVITGTDSIRFDTLIANRIAVPTVVEYKWLAKGMDLPLLRVNASLAGGIETITRVEYRDSLRVQNPNTGIEPEAGPLASLWPNPAKEQLFVKLSDNLREGVFELFNMEGKTALQARLHAGENRLHVAHLPAGTYIARVAAEGKLWYDKVLIAQ